MTINNRKPLVRFKNVSKTYPKAIFEKRKQVFQKLSFSLPEHSTLGLIGANGAGKSTSIKLLMDFIRPDSGEITLLGKSPMASGTRENIGYLPEKTNFPVNLNVLNMLSFTAAACHVPKNIAKIRAEKLLKQLNLWDVRKQQLRTYSKGMQQRASFAVALINDPGLLILDEPMSGLDPLGRNTIMSLILNLKQEGKTIIFCSHILQDVDLLADEILVLHKGESLFKGIPDELMHRQGTDNLPDAYLSLVEGGNNV